MSPLVPVPCSQCHQGHHPPPQPRTGHRSSWAQLRPPQPRSRTPRDGLVRGDAPGRDVPPREGQFPKGGTFPQGRDALYRALVPAGAGGHGHTLLPGPVFALGTVWVSMRQDKWTEQPMLVLPWGCPVTAALAPVPCPQPEFPTEGGSCVSLCALGTSRAATWDPFPITERMCSVGSAGVLGAALIFGVPHVQAPSPRGLQLPGRGCPGCEQEHRTAQGRGRGEFQPLHWKQSGWEGERDLARRRVPRGRAVPAAGQV